MSESIFTTVQEWQDAANSRDIERLMSVSDPNIELVDPHGFAHGHQVLKEWLEQAGLQLTTVKVFVRGNTVVASQDAVWRSMETNVVIGKARVASIFRVDHNRVVYVNRLDSLDAAFERSGLSELDEHKDSVSMVDP